jgi:hypothetical protein
MSTPQQPELHRSGRGDVTQEGRRQTREADQEGPTGGPTGPVPPQNRSGHRPEVDQDKPQGPPPTPESGDEDA